MSLSPSGGPLTPPRLMLWCSYLLMCCSEYRLVDMKHEAGDCDQQHGTFETPTVKGAQRDSGQQPLGS